MAKGKKIPSHVFKTEDGKYRVRYRQSSKYIFSYDRRFDTLEEALRANDEYLAKHTLNLLDAHNTQIMGFSNFCDYLLDWYRNKPKKPSHNTLRGYKSDMLKLKRIFKNKKINEITSYQIELALLNEKNRTKRSNGSNGKDKIGLITLHHEYTMLCIIFNKAEAWGFISKNPMRLVEEPVFYEKVIVVPEYEEFSDIENKINSLEIREKCQFLLALYSGVREEEVCGVHIKDFNFEEKTVSIKRAIVQDEQTRKYIEDKNKSNKSVRTIPLPEKYFDVLKEYLIYRKTIIDYLKFKNNNYKEIDNLFLNKEGDFYRPNRLSRMWSRFAKENNINLTFMV